MVKLSRAFSFAGGVLSIGFCLSLCGCYAGAAAVIVGSILLGEGGGGNGGASAPPVVSAVQVTGKSPPAAISFVLTDPASKPVDVEIFYSRGDSRPAPVLLTGSEQGLRGLSTSPRGVKHTRLWDFGKQVGTGFTPDLSVSVVIAGGLEATAEDLGLGNDAPEVSDIRLPPERVVVGIAGVGFTVSDTSNDLVSIQVEYDIQGDAPDLGWLTARPALTPHSAPPPAFAFRGVQARREGSTLQFFWDVVGDLGRRSEVPVKLRFSADDGTPDRKPPLESGVFTVSNNERPAARLDVEAFISNQDQRRGIPVPFEVSDAEGDVVLSVFQWRRESESFPALPDTRAEVEAILADPELRLRYQIANEAPLAVEGTVVPISAAAGAPGAKVRLPELATSAARILATGLVGREVEVLRAGGMPGPEGGGWGLAGPVSAIPLGAGTGALVLDGPAPGSFRVRKLDLANGTVLEDAGTFALGDPRAMLVEKGGGSALVALDAGEGKWALARVDLANRTAVALVPAGLSTFSGPVRGMAALGSGSVLLTAGDALLRIDLSEPEAPRVGRILSGLKTPWGIVADPLLPRRIYLAERDGQGTGTVGRVLAIDLDTLSRTAVVALGIGLPRPQSLALERSGARLLAVTGGDPAGTSLELRGVDLGDSLSGESFLLASGFRGGIGSLSSGPEGLRVLTLTGENRLAPGGGVAQIRTIAAYDPQAQEAALDRPFDPPLRPGQRWRIREQIGRLPAPREGAHRVFVWRSEDLAGGGGVLLRVTPYDTERGPSDDSRIARPVAAPLEVEPMVLGDGSSTPEAHSVAAGDLDRDGRLDLVCAHRNGISLFFQKFPGKFEASSGTIATPRLNPASVHAADLDGDGNQDLVSTFGSAFLTVHFGDPLGEFSEEPLDLPLSARARSVEAADLDGDSLPELVALIGNEVTGFFPGEKRSFSSRRLFLGAVALATADLDGDGDLDLAAAIPVATVLFQGITGEFTAGPVLGKSAASQVLPADLDQDGDADLVAVSGTRLTFFIQGPPGAFREGEGALDVTAGSTALVAGDLDGDGRLDLAAVSFAGSDLQVFFQRTSGAFHSQPLILGGPAKTPGTNSLLALDLDGDGDLDLISANRLGNDLTVFLQDSPGRFLSAPSHELGGPQLTVQPGEVLANDLNGDGALDVCSANREGAEPSLFFQRSPGVFPSKPDVMLRRHAVTNKTSIALGDLDGDGDLDIASGDDQEKTLRLYFQDPPGAFRLGAQTLATVIGGPMAIITADLDGDGKLDLVSANRAPHIDTIPQGGSLTIFTQKDSGTFGGTPLTLSNARTEGVANLLAADLDGDGDLDLAAASYWNSNSLLIFKQSEGGAFAVPVALQAHFGIISVCAADLNGDGRLDLASANLDGNDLTVYFQTTLGEFAAPNLTLGGPPTSTLGPGAVAAADLDRDGDLDLICVDWAPGNGLRGDLKVFFQRSPGQFSKGPDVVAGSLLWQFQFHGPTVCPCDLDGDGDLDLLYSSRDDNLVKLILGSE